MSKESAIAQLTAAGFDLFTKKDFYGDWWIHYGLPSGRGKDKIRIFKRGVFVFAVRDAIKQVSV